MAQATVYRQKAEQSEATMDTLPATQRDGARLDTQADTQAKSEPQSRTAVEIGAAPSGPKQVSPRSVGRRHSPKQEQRKPVATTHARSLSIEDFLDLTAHELRAPLTILKGQAQLLQLRLRRDAAEDDRARDLADLDKMLFQIERLSHQVSMLLDATHLTQRRFMLAPLRFDIAQILQRLISVCAAGSPGMTIAYEAPPPEVSFIGRGDRQRIETALCEFLLNAVRYGGAHCLIRLTREGDAHHPQARLEVVDTGIGVPAHERSAIFQEWTHGSNAEHPGLGLGLYVTREIIRRHHGRIGMRPRGKRGEAGSVFWLTLPLEPIVEAGE